MRQRFPIAKASAAEAALARILREEFERLLVVVPMFINELFGTLRMVLQAFISVRVTLHPLRVIFRQGSKLFFVFARISPLVAELLGLLRVISE